MKKGKDERQRKESMRGGKGREKDMDRGIERKKRTNSRERYLSHSTGTKTRPETAKWKVGICYQECSLKAELMLKRTINIGLDTCIDTYHLIDFL